MTSHLQEVALDNKQKTKPKPGTASSAHSKLFLTDTLQYFYVLRSCWQSCDRLHKLHPRFLILLENCGAQARPFQTEKFLSFKEPPHWKWFTLNYLPLAHDYLHKVCRKKRGRVWQSLWLIQSRLCSLAPGEVVLRRLGNRQEAGRTAAADKDRIHLR